MKKFSEWLYDYTGISHSVQENIGLSLLIVFILYLIQLIILKIAFSRVHDAKERYYWRNGVSYFVVGLAFLSLLLIWVESYGSLGTFLGLLSAGLAIALKDPISNFFAWIFIITRRPFRVGDRIQVGDDAGDIIDISIFQFTINEIGNWVDADQSTGRIIHLPNHYVFIKPQANYTKGFGYIWNEVSVVITFESNWKKCKVLLTEVAEEHAAHLSRGAQKQLMEASRRYMIFYTKLTPIVYTSVKKRGVKLTMRYLCLPQRKRSSEQAIWEDILNIVEQNSDITLAYPAYRIQMERQKDKPAI